MVEVHIFGIKTFFICAIYLLLSAACTPVHAIEVPVASNCLPVADKTEFEHIANKLLPDSFLLEKLERCERNLSGTGDTVLFGYSQVVSPVKGNCVFAKIEFNENNLNESTVIYPFIARKQSGGCPSHKSPTYVSLNRVPAEQDRDRLFILLHTFVNRLESGGDEFSSVFSSLGFFNRLFCEPCDLFQNRVVEASKSGEGLIIELFIRDFQSKPDMPLYLLGLKVSGELWFLLLGIEQDVLVLREISKAQL